ncbi:MAG: hypothetical protein GJ680_19170 [Alteromonadaceae bacterium]|nr:hypothetical protein [Alteromonadaceae bacterium]
MINRHCSLLFSATLLSCNMAFAQKFECETHKAQSPYQLDAPVGYDHTRFMPDTKTTLIKHFAAYSALFDDDDDDDGDGQPDRLGNPIAVMYELRGVEPDNGQFNEPSVSIERPNPWYRDPDLAFMWQNTKTKGLDRSYAGVGRVWNRGHWAMADHAQRISAQASCNTHVFWNASPQAAALNQGPWRFLENYTAALSNLHNQIWIVTGPIFDQAKEIAYIGSKGEVPVAVPHALFKVVFYQQDGNLRWSAFVFEQDYTINKHAEKESHRVKPLSSWVKCNQAKKRQHRYDLSAYVTSIGEIEKRTGLRFVPTLEDELREKVVNYLPNTVPVIPESYWDERTFCGVKALQFR